MPLPELTIEYDRDRWLSGLAGQPSAVRRVGKVLVDLADDGGHLAVSRQWVRQELGRASHLSPRAAQDAFAAMRSAGLLALVAEGSAEEGRARVWQLTMAAGPVVTSRATRPAAVVPRYRLNAAGDLVRVEELDGTAA